MLMKVWFLTVGFGSKTGWGTMLQTRPGFFLPGPLGIWDSEWISVPASAVSAEDVAHWPYTVSLLVQWLAFLGSLHWPVGGAHHGVGGVSFVEMLFFMSSGLVRG